MVEADVLNSDLDPAVNEASLNAESMKKVFLRWLAAGNSRKFSPPVCVSCIDKISEYAKNKKICTCNFWEIMQHRIFKQVYLKVIDSKLIRITDKSTYKVFIVAGQLYLKFLKEKPWIVDSSMLTASTSVDSTAETEAQLPLEPVEGVSRKVMLEKTLTEHFPNGFRSGSPIELSRFRRFFIEDFNEDVEISDSSLNIEIRACGTLFEGKVYAISIDTTEKIKKKVNSAIMEGAEVIFYEMLYSQNEDWLFQASVISEEMLKTLLTTLYPQFIYATNYFALKECKGNERIKIENELLRIWGDEVLLSYEQFAERLPYIPINKIKNTLAQNADFVWNAEGVYTHVDKVDITDEERADILDFVAAAYRTDAYATLSDVPLGEILERNFELSPTAVHSAVFAAILADKYGRRGKIITRKDDTLDALTIMKEYCRSLEKCTLQELLDFERELTGETHRWIPMEAGYAILIRTAEDTYVAGKYVRFIVSEIDNALEHFVTGGYLPLRSVTTFAAFPECGQVWNLYLLESYCRRFSNQFRFEVLAVNSRNAGVIVRKDCVLSYIEIMADAVAASDVVLEKKAIEEYLCSNGYIGRRFYAKVDDLIQLAKTIRERRN